jgi:transposase
MATRDIRFAHPAVPREQLVLYSTCLDDVVSDDALVRRFDALLDKVDWEPWERAYAGCGQPPIHPRYLAGALLFGLMRGYRSSRTLEELACKHVDFMWLLEGQQPDHSTFCNFRRGHRKALKELQKQIARLLIAREEQALMALLIDGTRVRADSDRHEARTAETLERLVEELNRRLEALERCDAREAPSHTEYFEGMAPANAPEDELAQIDAELARLRKRRDQCQKALGVARVRDARNRAHKGKKARPVRVPVSDPDSQIVPNKEGGFAPNYTPVAVVDQASGAIVHADVATGSDEAGVVGDAVAAAASLVGHKPEAVVADTNFATGENLALLDEEKIPAYMPTRTASPPDNPALRSDPTTPVPEEEVDRLPRVGQYFGQAAFLYDAESDVYYCPAGKTLTPLRQGMHHGVHRVTYACPGTSGCPYASRCTTKGASCRTVVRDQYEPLREATNARMATPDGQAIYRTRAPGIEGVFGHIKAAMGVRKFLLRGLDNVRTEWNWVCTAYNIKKLLSQPLDPPIPVLEPPRDQLIPLKTGLFTLFSRIFGPKTVPRAPKYATSRVFRALTDSGSLCARHLIQCLN